MGEWTTTLVRRLRPPRAIVPVPAFGHVPAPPSERGHWLLAGAIAALGVAVLVAVLTGLVGRSAQRSRSRRRRCWSPPPRRPPPSAPRAAACAATPAAGARGRSSRSRPAQQSADAARLEDPLQTRISRRWMEGFYPIYAVAQTHVRRQLAADRLDPRAGVGVLDRPLHLPGPELRRLLRRADAVQRHQRERGTGSDRRGIWSATPTSTDAPGGV